MVGLELAFGTRRLEPKKLLLILEFFIKRFALGQLHAPLSTMKTAAR